MSGETQLHFFYLDHQSNYWERLNSGLHPQSTFCQERELTSSLLPDFQLTLGSNHHLSVFGPRFCVADDEGFIRVSRWPTLMSSSIISDLSQVLEIYYVGLSVRTSEVCRLRQKLSWVQWTLWRDKVPNQFLVFKPTSPLDAR